MRTIGLADRVGAHVNLTWWKGPFPHAPQPGHEQSRKRLMDDFAGVIHEARAKAAAAHVKAAVNHVTIMNEVNSYDIAKALEPLKTMKLYELLYRDLHESLANRIDPIDGSKTLAETVKLVGGDLVRRHGEPEAVAHAMEAHHNEVEPQTVEAVIVQAADALSGALQRVKRKIVQHQRSREERRQWVRARHQKPITESDMMQ